LSPQPPLSYLDRLRRLLFPSDGARSNAGHAVDEPAVDGWPLVLDAADLAALAGHPAGLARRHGDSPLDTDTWARVPAHLALLDRDGVVVSVNRAWRHFGLTHGAAATVGLGMNYLDICDRAADQDEPEAEQAATMIRAALSGATDARRLAYPVQSTAEPYWFSLQVAALPGKHRGALVVHQEITTGKQLEPSPRTGTLSPVGPQDGRSVRATP
jgi:hypothetical protein